MSGSRAASRSTRGITKTATQLNLMTAGVAAGYKIARGVHTTVAASDTVVTGLATVVAVVVSLQTDASVDIDTVTASIGDQAGAPAAGSVIIKTWKVTTGGVAGNPTPTATSAFSKAVNWIAVGT